ncbi:MAG: NAD(P)-dependent oxidoreductase [Acidimicrobiia bacterium]|nr:NAD(P)-dependent oxidoreductase [Acidimicrobiia bacterium]
MATHLLRWPSGLVVCDPAPGAVDPFVGAGATAVADPGAVAATCGIVSVMVRDDAQVTDVVDGPRGILRTARPGTVVVIHSTITPDTAETLASAAAEVDVAVVDAPVSGGAIGAAEGTLAVMVGGDETAVERCRPALEHFASLVLHFGPVGSGTRAKVARNLISFVGFAAAAEAQRLAEASGLGLRRLGRIVRHSDGVTGGVGAIFLRGDTAPLADDDPLRPILEHTRSLGEKDLALALELAAELGVDAPFAALAAEQLAAALGVPHDTDPRPPTSEDHP